MRHRIGGSARAGGGGEQGHGVAGYPRLPGAAVPPAVPPAFHSSKALCCAPLVPLWYTLSTICAAGRQGEAYWAEQRDGVGSHALLPPW